MKQKSGGIKRLMEFTGKHRGLLTVSRILSGISSVFILGPFLCVYFAARDLVGRVRHYLMQLNTSKSVICGPV